MEEKKIFRLNCNVCDTRKMREEMFEGYEEIRVNAVILLVNENSRKILDRYPIQLNVDAVVDAEGEIDIQTQNGTMELKTDQQPQRDAILIVNGTLDIAPGTEELLKKYLSIVVNGTVKYPKSLTPYLSRMIVNGMANGYPDDCIQLKRSAVIDVYFPLRAKENGRYYAERRVVLLDEKVDVNALVEKNVQFLTPELLTTEGMVKEIIPLLSDDTELIVVPDGCVFLNGDVRLDEALIHKSGTKLYVNGDLTLEPESTPWISELDYLQVNGEVRLLPEQKEAFLALDAEYKKLKLRKGRLLENKLEVHVDQALLAEAPNGICLRKCVEVTIDAAVTEEQIKDILELENCVEVVCTREQQGAVQLVSHNVTDIVVDGEKEQTEEKERSAGTWINADSYVL